MKLTGFKEVRKAIALLSNERTLGTAIRRAWNYDAKNRLQPYIRRKMKHRLGGTGKLAKSYTVKAFGETTSDLKLQIYSRVPAAETQEFGGIITPRHGKYLALPTDNAKTNIGLGRSGGQIFFTRKRLTPRILIAASKKPGGAKVFTARSKKSGKLIMYQVIEDQNKKLKKYFRRSKTGYHIKRIMPMFVLLPRVILPPRTNIRGIFDRELPKIAAITNNAIVNLWETTNG